MLYFMAGLMIGVTFVLMRREDRRIRTNTTHYAGANVVCRYISEADVMRLK